MLFFYDSSMISLFLRCFLFHQKPPHTGGMISKIRKKLHFHSTHTKTIPFMPKNLEKKYLSIHTYILIPFRKHKVSLAQFEVIEVHLYYAICTIYAAYVHGLPRNGIQKRRPATTISLGYMGKVFAKHLTAPAITIIIFQSS